MSGKVDKKQSCKNKQGSMVFFVLGPFLRELCEGFVQEPWTSPMVQ